MWPMDVINKLSGEKKNMIQAVVFYFWIVNTFTKFSKKEKKKKNAKPRLQDWKDTSGFTVCQTREQIMFIYLNDV